MTDSPDDAVRRPSTWPLDPAVTFLNHGSFGSCPGVVLEQQQEWRDRMERQPVQFFVRDLEALLDRARESLAAFVGAAANDLVFVANATSGVNAVLRSLSFRPGEELLVTNQEYNACRNTLDFVAGRGGASVIVAEIPFPVGSEEDVVGAVLGRVSPRTRLALLDHVVSQTGMVLPVGRLVRELQGRGVDVLVDGAHAPGMLPLNLAELGAAYYTGNCHKWLCAPKGAAFLCVRPDRQEGVRPTVISHGANSPRKDRSRFQIEFGWTGTGDPSAWLTVPKAIDYLGGLFSGGWPEVMRRNRELALAARRVLGPALGLSPPCPDAMVGSLAAFPLPDAPSSEPPKTPLYLDPLQEGLLKRHAIEVPVIPWPEPPRRVLRVSAQLYNSLSQYERLAAVLPGMLAQEAVG
jgi:isopenicillin-N epimerase